MVGTVSITYLPRESKPQVLANLVKVRVAANYRVAAHDYRLFAGGDTHFLAFNKLMPWDHLAGCADPVGGGRVRRALRRLARTCRSTAAAGCWSRRTRTPGSLLRREVFTV